MAVPPSESPALGAVILPSHWLVHAGAFAELAKPRLTALAVFAALFGYALAAGSAADPVVAAVVVIGAWFVGGGANALNQYLERDLDARMRRTDGRPLPTGRLQPEAACCFGVVLAATGVGFLTIRVGVVCGVVAAGIVLSYLFAYTPLKRGSPWSTVAGTVPGALPILLGWTASGRAIDPAAWIIFALVALWQLPHFFAIGWLHRADYSAAGFPIWPARDPSGRWIALISAALCAGLIPLSLLIARYGPGGRLYAMSAAVLGLGFTLFALAWARSPSTRTARAMFHASIVYLPLLMLCLLMDAR